MIGDAIGLDIGGANIKAATSRGPVLSRPFELWKHPDRLGSELEELAGQLPSDGPVAVTMTGELCDCFHTKQDGVESILASVCRVFQEESVRVWSTDGRFVSVAEALQSPMLVAAANWHAQATWIGKYLTSGDNHEAFLLVDTGSTTTDVIPIHAGRPIALGRTDPERLRSRELVYTGSRRTPVCAVIPGELAAELFATVQDAYLLLGLVAENSTDHGTADGRPATREFAHARMARMLGGDARSTPADDTIELARGILQRQIELIRSAMEIVAGRLTSPIAAIYLSGSGEFLARRAAEEFRIRTRPDRRIEVHSLADSLGYGRSSAACAYALAVLAEDLIA